MPLLQHEFYVYHAGPLVYARWGDREPVLARECETPQEAHDVVQSVVNPRGRRHDHKDYWVDRTVDVERTRVCLGFNHPKFQAQISGNCEAFVRDAYAKAGVTSEKD